MDWNYNESAKHLFIQLNYNADNAADIDQKIDNLADCRGAESVELVAERQWWTIDATMKKVAAVLSEMNLRRLKLREQNAYSVQTFFRHLQTSSQLEKLILQFQVFKNFSYVSVLPLVQGLIEKNARSLKHIDLSLGNGEYQYYGKLEGILQTLVNCPLESFILRNAILDSKGAARGISCKPYVFDGVQESRALVVLLQTKPLIEFGLDEVYLSNESSKILLPAVMECNSIRSLHLGPVSSGGTRYGIGAIASRLPEMSNITKVVWSGPTRALVPGLEASETIKELVIKDIESGACFTRIANVLKGHQYIRKVEIKHGLLWSPQEKEVTPAAKDLAKALVENPAVDEFYFGPTMESTLAAFAEHDPAMNGLKSLRFGINEYRGVSSVSKLTRALKQNQSIEQAEIVSHYSENPSTSFQAALDEFQGTINRQVGSHLHRNASNRLLRDEALPTGAWPLVLGKFNEKKWTDAFWYTLQQKPDLVVGASGQSGRKRSHEEMTTAV